MGTLDFALKPYLDRIRYASEPLADLRTLNSLHEAHLAAVPFENLDILLGKPILLGLDALQRKLVADRRGGYCFEQNTLFRAALETIGFRVTSLAARVRIGARVVRPRTHMLLRVETDEGSHIADVGFGGDGPLHPLPLDDTDPDEDATHRLTREGDGWWVLLGRVTGDWTELYAFTLEPHYPVDFEMANHFTSTYASSPFVQFLTAQRTWRDRRAILRDRELQIVSRGTTERLEVRDPDHLLEILASHFDLSFPPGTRFSRPEF